MSFLRNLRDLAAEAHHELWCAADRVLQWAENRWLWQHTHQWVDISELQDRDVREQCVDCRQVRVQVRGAE